MNRQNKSDNYFFYFILLGIIVSILSASIFFWTIKTELQNGLKGVEIITESETNFNATLYYTHTSEFTEMHKIGNSGRFKGTLFFQFPKSSEMIKRFRLDFGNDPKLKAVKIKSFSLVFNDKRTTFNKKDIFDSRILASSSVFLNREDCNIEIKNSVKPFDPYIVFPYLGELTIRGYRYTVALLMPFLVLISIYIIKYRKEFEIPMISFLILGFVVCIPLKIAWTTFFALLLCVSGIVLTIHQGKRLTLNSVFYILMGIFLVLVLCGRPASFSAMDKLFSLPLFAILSSTISFPKRKIYRQYIFVFLVFNAIVVASGMHFLIWFNDFYGMPVSKYFSDIKTYSGIVRGWVYYDHAAFLSFFGLVGMLFAHKLFSQHKLEKNILFLYDILLLIFIVLVGTRICLLIYAIFLLNLFVKWNIKKRVLINTVLFITVAITLVYNIDKIDRNRYHLWAVSWNAIKEKPWFGYRLGKSNEILHSSQFLAQAGFSEELPLNHSHNQFITFLLEIGIVGLAVLTVFLAYFFYRAKFYRNTTLVLLFYGLGYLSLTESILETSKPLYVLCFFFLLVATKTGRENNDIQSAT